MRGHRDARWSPSQQRSSQGVVPDPQSKSREEVRGESWGLETGKEGDSWPQGQVFWATEERSRTSSSLTWEQATRGTRL